MIGDALHGAQAVFSHLFKAQGHLVAEPRLRSVDRKVPRCVLVHVIVLRADTQGETGKKPQVENARKEAERNEERVECVSLAKQVTRASRHHKLITHNYLQ